MLQDFNTIYSNLTSTLETLEKKRLELKAKGARNGGIAAGIVFVAGFALLVASEMAGPGIAILAVLCCIIFIYCIHIKSAELSVYYKNDVISQIVSVICPGAFFQPDQGISESSFINSGLFMEPDRYQCEDLISGQIDKTTFLCSEVHAEERRTTINAKGQTQTYWVDIFKGFLFIADFQKDFKGQTTIFRNSWIKLRFGEQRVKLENPDFEKSFDVYSTDQVEARYLLTPSIMERFIALDRKFPGKISISFRQSNVIIAIPDGTNHFEANIWSSVSDRSKLEREFQTVHALTEIISDLNLNIRIWTKE